MDGPRRTQRSGGGKALPTARIVAAERSLPGVRALMLLLGGEGGEVLGTDVALEWFVCAVVSIVTYMDLHAQVVRRRSNLQPVCVTRCLSSLPFCEKGLFGPLSQHFQRQLRSIFEDTAFK